MASNASRYPPARWRNPARPPPGSLRVREKDPEGRTAGGRVLDPCATAVGLGEPRHQRESDAEARSGRGGTATEWLEDRPPIPPGNTGPGIFDGEKRAARMLVNADVDRGLWRVPRRVAEQVPNDRLDLRPVDRDHDGLRLHRDVGPDRLGHVARNLLRELGEIRRAPVERNCVDLDALEAQ